MTTKSHKNSMMMTMIVFHREQHISTVSRQTIAAARVHVTSGAT